MRRIIFKYCNWTLGENNDIERHTLQSFLRPLKLFVQVSHTGKCVQFVSNELDAGKSIFFKKKTQGKCLNKNSNKKGKHNYKKGNIKF
jgi:hypothetical protein